MLNDLSRTDLNLLVLFEVVREERACRPGRRAAQSDTLGSQPWARAAAPSPQRSAVSKGTRKRRANSARDRTGRTGCGYPGAGEERHLDRRPLDPTRSTRRSRLARLTAPRRFFCHRFSLGDRLRPASTSACVLTPHAGRAVPRARVAQRLLRFISAAMDIASSLLITFRRASMRARSMRRLRHRRARRPSVRGYPPWNDIARCSIWLSRSLAIAKASSTRL